MPKKLPDLSVKLEALPARQLRTPSRQHETIVRAVRYLSNAIAIGLLVVCCYVVVAKLTPIPRTMADSPPAGLACEFYNATIFPRTAPHLFWGCSGGDVFADPAPAIVALAGAIVGCLMLGVGWGTSSVIAILQTFGLFIEVVSLVASFVRMFFWFEGYGNLVYAAWTLPLLLTHLGVFLYFKYERARQS